MNGSDVSVTQEGAHVAVVCMHRPPNNYFDTGLIAEVATAYEDLGRTGWCRSIVLASEGRHFCAGLDFAGNAGQDIAALYEAALRLFAAPLPVVAAVQGAAIGGGCGLALSTDFRVATPPSRFSANFARLGFHHGFALTVTLPRAVGRQPAADLLLTGRRVGGEQALALGLCDRLVGEDEVRAESVAYATELAAAGPLAVRSIRATLRQGLVEEARLAMAHECAEQTTLHGSADFAEGVRATAERRDPAFPRGLGMAAPVAHERNTSFTWSDHAGPFRVVSATQARQYDEDGFFVLEDALTQDEITALVAAIDPFEERGAEALRGLEGGRFFIARADEITFTTHLVLQSAVLQSFTRSALLGDLCADLIGPDVRLYWDQAVYKKPGTQSPFPWHQDNGYAFVEPQQYLTCWVALTDATEENGCPWVVPGLHRLGTLAHEYSDIGFVCLRDPADAVAVPARAGSIVVFSSLTPHSTGGNRTDAVRKAYIVQYAPDGATVLRPEPDGVMQRVAASDAGRQYEVLRGGRRITS